MLKPSVIYPHVWSMFSMANKNQTENGIFLRKKMSLVLYNELTTT